MEDVKSVSRWKLFNNFQFGSTFQTLNRKIFNTKEDIVTLKIIIIFQSFQFISS